MGDGQDWVGASLTQRYHLHDTILLADFYNFTKENFMVCPHLPRVPTLIGGIDAPSGKLPMTLEGGGLRQAQQGK